MDEKNIVTLLSDEKIEEQIDIILHFLKSVHPSLTKSEGFRPSVELRPLPRVERSYLLSKSLNLWDLSEDSVNRLREFLKRHNGKPDCLYYSVFTYDNNKKSVTKEGKASKPGKITSSSAIYAEEIAIDFDGIGFEEYTNLVDRFEDLGIYALWVFTGHGYHAHILLNEALKDKNLLRRLVYKFRSKGFDCDNACVDPARVMRLPGTFNNKCFQDDYYKAERANPPWCEVVQSSQERYSLDAIMKKLDSLPTVNTEDEKLFAELAGSAPSKSSSKQSSSKSEEVEDSIVVKRIEYPYISQFELPAAVEKMLAYTPHGYRNKTLGFLIKFLKNQYKLGKNAILEILTLWGKEACDPGYEPVEFKSDFNRLYYNYNGLGYDPALIQKFGPIDFKALIQLRKKDIHIPQKFFRDFPDIGNGEVRLYLAIKMLEHIEVETTQEKIAELLSINVRSMRDSLQQLVKMGHCYMTKGNPRRQIPNTYHTNRINSVHDGFVTFGYNDLNTYLNELCEQGGRTRSNAELKLYLFMRWKFYTGEIYMSQSNLGKHLGVAQNTISVAVNRLQDKHFLKIRKLHINAIMESCEYTLLR